jgi:hypothetical protein
VEALAEIDAAVIKVLYPSVWVCVCVYIKIDTCVVQISCGAIEFNLNKREIEILSEHNTDCAFFSLTTLIFEIDLYRCACARAGVSRWSPGLSCLLNTMLVLMAVE